MNYNSKYSGQFYQMEDGITYTKNVYGKYAGSTALSHSISQVQLTGYYVITDSNNTLYQNTAGSYIDLNDGWQYVAYAPLRQYTAKDAQYYVNKIIKANQQIIKNNLFCARFYNKLTPDEMWTLYQLQLNLESRNNKLIEDGYCTGLKVSSPPGYAMLSTELSTFMNLYNAGAIGIAISTTTMVVIAAIVVASMATAAYFAYKYLASEAEKDIKYSEELTKTLMSKLTEEEYQQLLEETNGIVTRQKLLAQFGGFGSAFKWGLIAAAGVVIYKTIKNKREQ